MSLTHPLTPAVLAAAAGAVLVAALAAGGGGELAPWVLLPIAAGYSVSSSP